jgi:hypothetical protein
MSLLARTEDVEQVAKTWLEKKYGKKMMKLKFVEVMGEGGLWNVKARVKISTGVLAVTPMLVQLKIDSNSTDVLGYAESEIEEK